MNTGTPTIKQAVYTAVLLSPGVFRTAEEITAAAGLNYYGKGAQVRGVLKALTDTGKIERHYLGLKGKVGRGAVFEYGVRHLGEPTT